MHSKNGRHWAPNILKLLSGLTGSPSQNIVGCTICRIQPLYSAHRPTQSQINAHLQAQAAPPSTRVFAEPRLRIADDSYRSTHPDHKALTDEIQRIDAVAIRPGNVVIVVAVLDRKSRLSHKCFIDRLKVLGKAAGSAGLGDRILYMMRREIEASTEVAQTLLDHLRGH